MQDALKHIVSRSSYIYERLSPTFEPTQEQDLNLISTQIEAWKQALDAEAKSETLEKYMQWEGLDENSLQRMVGHVRIVEGVHLPEWADILGEALLLAQEPAFWQERAPGWIQQFHEQSEGEAGVESSHLQTIPFEELYPPFLEIFQSRITTNPGYFLLDKKAQRTLWRKLLIDFANLASEAFYNDFRSFREHQAFGPLVQLVAKSSKSGSRSLYRQYLRNMQAGGMVAFFLKLPVLARLFAVTLQTQIEAQGEFLQRLHDDQSKIALAFEKEQKAGKVIDLQLTQSDPHRGGRSVVVVTFESGLQLVYKPKNLEIATAYNYLLTWLNDHDSPVSLRPLRLIDLGDHGWIEFARHDPCSDSQAVGRYYRRVGALLCLMYALEATDCHEENLIACGEQPVLIDNETIFHHRVPEESAGKVRESAFFKARMILENSTLQVGLLPGYNIGKDAKIFYDISGLGGEGDQMGPSQRMVFHYTNTDAMETTFEQGKLPQAANRPYLQGGVPVPMEDYIDDLDGGFRDMHRFLAHKRQEMLQPNGPLQAFKDRLARFIFRPTQVYVWLNDGARRPNHLRDGVDYSLYLERLARAFLQLENEPSWYPLLTAERHALCTLDIPFFTASTSSDDLDVDIPGGRNTIKNYFSAPSYGLAVERLLSLSEENLEFQSQVIQISMRCRQAEQLQEKTSSVAKQHRPHRKALIKTLDQTGFVAEAIALADLLDRQAIRGEDGSVAWFGPQYIKEANRFRLNVLGDSLYDGLAGIALFLAALDKVLRHSEIQTNFDSPYRELALAALQPLRSSLEGRSFLGTVNTIGAGGAYGVGGLFYTLAKCAGFLDEPDLLKEAQEAVEQTTTGLSLEDNALGVMDGMAGAILGLLAVYRTTSQTEALERAVDCGKLLTKKSTLTPSGRRVWVGADDRPLSGFSNGAAGIAYALLRLHQIASDETFRSTADEALSLEPGLDSDKGGNRLDQENLQEKPAGALDGGNAPGAWRQDLVGDTMGRIGNLAWLDTPHVREETEAVLNSALLDLENSPDRPDHLYCGNMGNIELLLTASLYLDKSDLVEKAREEASRLAYTARCEGGYRTTGFLKRGIYSPGFFLGISGIGYELLRLAYLRLLPNVLLWE